MQSTNGVPGHVLVFFARFAKEIDMSNRTPPLPALRAFAALVRLGSIAAAAEELSLTQGAIAHQIRALESALEVALVERTGRRLALTEQGRIYGYQVRQALDDLADATEKTRRFSPRPQHEPIVRIAVLPSFAHGWLLPRLHGFRKLYPRVRLVFEGSMTYADLDAGHVHGAIRFGHGRWPDVVARRLMNDSQVLVAAPRLLGKRTGLKLAQVLRLPVLHADENWAGWLSSMGEVDVTLTRPKEHMAFTDSTHLLEAVRLGLGVALTRRSIADHLLERGEIVLAHTHECVHASSYYALLPKAGAQNEAVELFLGWLQGACAQYAEGRGWR